VDERVYILLPFHDRRAVTENAVRCLSRQEYRNFHAVLIDDGSTDGSADMALDYLPGSTVLRGDGDWWWAGSLHQGYKWLRRSAARPEDLVLILNDDTRFEPGFLGAAVRTLNGRGRSLLLAQLYNVDTGAYLESGVHADWRNLNFRPASDPAEINCFSTRGLFLRVGDMMEIGGFHPVLLPHYASDYEYTMRAYRKGFALVTSPEVRLWLDEHTTGIREFQKQRLATYLRTAFSKRALGNPFYWSSFVLLASPWRYVPANLWRVWRGFIRQTIQVLT
jgi:GT2 family glycosyltransferase